MNKRLLQCWLVSTACILLPMTAAHAADAAAVDEAQVDGGSTVEEVVVTAQRREEKLQDVPISITVLKREDLVSAGIQNTHDLERVTPALQMQSFGGWLQPAIRGISSTGASPGDSSNVAIYVDGVYQPNQASQLFDLPDVAGVEILKGPQGALYGQNAAGGAIIINTLKPSQTLSGRVYAGYGSYNDATVGGYVSGPISDTISASITGAFEDRGGFRRDIINGGHDDGLTSSLVRAKVLFSPSDTASVLVTGFYSKREDTGLFAGSVINGNSLGYLLYPDAPVAGPKETATTKGVGSSFETFGGSIVGNFEVGPGRLNTVTSFSRVEVFQRADVDYGPANIAITSPDPAQSSFIQEINYIAEKRGKFAWSAGVFYMSSEDGYQDTGEFNAFANLTLSPLPAGPIAVDAPFNGSLQKQVGAAYLEATYDIIDELTLTVGGRYSHERQRAFAAFTANGTRPPPTEFPGGPQEFTNFSPHASLTYKPTPLATFYASYSRGFKSGIINILDFSGPAVKPENVTGYEIGYKGRPFPGAYVEVSAFHYDYRDLQVSHFVSPAYVYENAGAARINGVEVTAAIKPTDGLTLSAGLSYLDAKYTQYNGQDVLLGVLVPNAAGRGNDQITVNVTGKPLIRVPKIVANASARYEIETSSGTIGLFGSVLYNDGFSEEPNARVRQEAYTTVDGEISFSPSGAPGLRVSAWGKNLTDAVYYQSVLLSVLADGVSYAPPLTAGVKVEYAF